MYDVISSYMSWWVLSIAHLQPHKLFSATFIFFPYFRWVVVAAIFLQLFIKLNWMLHCFEWAVGAVSALLRQHLSSRHHCQQFKRKHNHHCHHHRHQLRPKEKIYIQGATEALWQFRCARLSLAFALLCSDSHAGRKLGLIITASGVCVCCVLSVERCPDKRVAIAMHFRFWRCC